MIRIALILLILAPSLGRAAEQPNILFLFADDMTFRGIQVLGGDLVQTPHLDALAARGTRFTRCYNMGSWSGAVCVASRTMLNTGRTVWRAERVYKTSEQERVAGRWWSEYMKAAGYRTYMTGKWHCQANAHKAFDVARNVRGGMPKDTPEGYNRPQPGVPDPWSPSDPKFGGFWEGGTHWSEVVANDAIDFLEEASGRSEPYFMYIAFNAPHDPRQSPQEYLDRYPVEEVPVPVNFQPLYPFKDDIGCGPGLRDEKLGPFPRTSHAVQVHRREYYALITHLDAQIGRILEALEKSPDGRETWIFFTADHGLACGEHGLFGKQNQYDHSVRVPFLVAGPGVEAGGEIRRPIYLQSVMPTSLQLAGMETLPDHVEFESLLPLLAGEGRDEDRPVYGGYLDLQRMITDGGWKLIVYPRAKAVRLYHVEADPYERHDLAADPKQQSRVRELFGKLLALQGELEDTLDLQGVFPDLAP